MFRYLLDQLSDEDRREIEQRYLEDDAYFDLVCAAEENLIVAYLDGRLAKPDHVRFEEIYSSHAQRQKVETISRVRRFARHLQGKETKRSLEQNTPSLFGGLLWFALVPSASRGANEQTLIALPKEAADIGLKVELDEVEEHDTYEARLKPAYGDDEIWHADRLHVESSDEGRHLRVQIPAALLTAGDYVLYVRGIDANGRVDDPAAYTFSIQPSS